MNDNKDSILRQLGQRQGNPDDPGIASTVGKAVILELWPTSGAGTEDDPYLISSADDWNKFASNVSVGFNYSGKYVKLTEDISVTTMVGNSETNSFQGTFLGDGEHTLTFNHGTAEKFSGDFGRYGPSRRLGGRQSVLEHPARSPCAGCFLDSKRATDSHNLQKMFQNQQKLAS